MTKSTKPINQPLIHCKCMKSSHFNVVGQQKRKQKHSIMNMTFSSGMKMIVTMSTKCTVQTVTVLKMSK